MKLIIKNFCKSLFAVLIIVLLCPTMSYAASKPGKALPQSQNLGSLPANSVAEAQNSQAAQQNLIDQKQAAQDLAAAQVVKKKPAPQPPAPPVAPPPAPIAPAPAPVQPPAPPVFVIQRPIFLNGELRFQGPNVGTQYVVTRDLHLLLKNADGSQNEQPLNENTGFPGPNGGTYRFDQFGRLFFQTGNQNTNLFKLSTLRNFFQKKRIPPPPIVVQPPLPPAPPVVAPPAPPLPPAQKPPKKKK